MCESNFTFENFVVKDTNRFAHAAALAVAENPNIVYNPLVIYGQTGVGKTHLVLAIKNYINKQFTDKKIEFVKGEDFSYQCEKVLNEGKTDFNDIKTKYYNADILIIDDIDFIVGKQYVQEIFLDIIKCLHKNKKQIIVTTSCCPEDIKELDDRIKLFLNKGIIADIVPDDFEESETWEQAKDFLVEHYFNEDEQIKEIAHKAYNPNDVENKRMLAQWFKANNYPDEARAWEIKANSIAEELGFDLPEN